MNKPPTLNERIWLELPTCHEVLCKESDRCDICRRSIKGIQALIDEAIVAELRKIMDRHLEIEENGGTSLPLLLVANRLVELTTPKEEQN